MALSEFEQRKCEKALEVFLAKRRPPPHIRDQVDLGYRIEKQSVEIFEIRPKWDDPKVILEHSVAKATYVKTQNVWKIFWMRADLKWHTYDPIPNTKMIEVFVDIVDDDTHGCFFG